MKKLVWKRWRNIIGKANPFVLIRQDAKRRHRGPFAAATVRVEFNAFDMLDAFGALDAFRVCGMTTATDGLTSASPPMEFNVSHPDSRLEMSRRRQRLKGS